MVVAVTHYVIVPGIDGSDDRHWQSRWEKRLGADATRIAPASWEEPDRVDWAQAVDAAYRHAQASNQQVVFIAHSLGCWAVADWLSDHPSSDTPTFLVAPPHPDNPTFADRAPSFTTIPVAPLTAPTALISSDDDPYCQVDQAQTLAAGWGADWTRVEPSGHINSASNLGDWPTGWALLQGFLAALG